MMKSAALYIVGILLCVSLCSGYSWYDNITLTDPILDNGTPVTAIINVPAVDSTTFANDISIVVFLKLTHAQVSDLKIELIDPSGNPYVITRGNINNACLGKNLDAVFSDHATIPHGNPFEKCDANLNPMVRGNIRPAESSGFTPSSGTNDGDWTIKVTDIQGNGNAGVLTFFAILFSDDIDDDAVDNNDDSCPLHYSPIVPQTIYQPDENENGIGNECECERRNFHVPDDHRKICLYLDNWGWDFRHYKGQRKSPGDWAVAVMPIQTFGTFQPGDYTHKSTWLDCDCTAFPILP